MNKKEFNEKLDKVVCIKGIKKSCKNWLTYYIQNYPYDHQDGEVNKIMDRALAGAGFESDSVKWKYKIGEDDVILDLNFYPS